MHLANNSPVPLPMTIPGKKRPAGTLTPYVIAVNICHTKVKTVSFGTVISKFYLMRFRIISPSEDQKMVASGL